MTTAYLQTQDGNLSVPEDQIYWKPHPGAQTKALTRTEFEVLYGGARGGGKSDAGMAWLLREADNPRLRALVLRKSSIDLEDWIDRAQMMYRGVGAVRAGNPPRFTFPAGAIVRTGHLKDENAYTKYLGHEYQRILIEELTLIPSEALYLKLLSSCRSTIQGLEARIFCTTNPGEIGHKWVKDRFIDVQEWGKPYYYTVEVDGKTYTRSRVFIHATMDDNPTLIQSDPNYIATIEALRDKDPELYKAWRFGSWDVFAGQVFGEFTRKTHVIKPLEPKKVNAHYLKIDWGYSGKEGDQGAFAALASALVESKYQGQVFHRVITYQEWYDKHKTPDEWAEIIYNDVRGRKFFAGVCDPDMFNTEKSGATAIADQMVKKWKELNRGQHWLTLTRGVRNRVGRVGITHNWLQMAPDGLPYWLIAANCKHLIRTLPMLVHDDHQVEAVDKAGEDHLWDSASYGLSRIKFIHLDHIGGISEPTRMRKALPAPIMDLDLSEFEKRSPRVRDWRVI